MTSVLAEQVRRWRADRMAFRREAVTLEDGRPWGEVAESWQAEDFAALDSGRFRHAYLERPRGHAKTFDLGSYPQGQSKKVVFDKPGTVEVECAIHPEMKLVVEVK